MADCCCDYSWDFASGIYVPMEVVCSHDVEGASNEYQFAGLSSGGSAIYQGGINSQNSNNNYVRLRPAPASASDGRIAYSSGTASLHNVGLFNGVDGTVVWSKRVANSGVGDGLAWLADGNSFWAQHLSTTTYSCIRYRASDGAVLASFYKSEINTSPTVGLPNRLLADVSGNVTAILAPSGTTPIWKTYNDSGTELAASDALTEGVAYALALDDTGNIWACGKEQSTPEYYLYEYDPDGTLLNTYDLGDNTLLKRAVAINDTDVYVGFLNGTLRRYDRATMTQQWTVSTGMSTLRDVSLNANGVFVCGTQSASGSVQQRALSNGAQDWQTTVSNVSAIAVDAVPGRYPHFQ